MYRVTPWAIIKLNNLANPNLIFVGQPLQIP
jgi:LysM repeat protein